MNKVIGLGVVFGSAVAIWACSSSSSKAPSDNGGDDGGNGAQDSGNSPTGDGATAASCDESQINSMFSALGYDAGIVGDGGAVGSCVQTMCSSEITACKTESCGDCESALASCAGGCISFDASLPPPPADAATSCDAPGPECAALSTCCSKIAQAYTLFNQLSPGSALATSLMGFSSSCSTNAQACDEPTCTSTISAVNSATGMMVCTPP